MSLHCRFCRIFGKFTDEHNGPMDFKGILTDVMYIEVSVLLSHTQKLFAEENYLHS